MRLVYLGDGPWAHQALDRLLTDPDVEIACIVPRFETQDPELRRRAETNRIDFVPIRDINTTAALELLKGYEPDLLVSMSFDQILRRAILALCPSGAINCHAGALPFYRGRNVLNWALINGEDEFGVTAHFIDEGIDTGDIILQRKAPISIHDTYATLLARAAELCGLVVHEAVRLIADHDVQRTAQSSIHPVGFYTGRRLPGDEWIDWNWTSQRIYNFVRAITDPGPCARTMVDGAELKVVKAALIPEAPTYLGTVGEVVGRDGGTLHVKSGDSTIALTEIRGEPPAKLRIGSRFHSPPDPRVTELEHRIERLERAIEGRGDA